MNEPPSQRRPAARRRTPVEPVAVEPHRCTPTEQRRLLGASPFFAGLSDAELAQAAASFRQANYRAGEVIHRAGDPAARLSIVVAGQVKIARPTPGGQDVLLAIIGPDEHFGSLLELGDPTYRDDASAHTDCCVLWTSAEAFHALLLRYPAAAMATLALVAARLRAAQETIEQLSAYPVDRRVAATLLALADRMGREEDGAILIDTVLSRQDLADMTGATVETVSRVLSDFRRAGLVDSGRRWIAVRDRVRLSELARRGA